MFAEPEKILKQFGIREDMIIADLGAGSGFYSILAAQMAPKGKVYAVEVIQDYLTTIKNKIKGANLTNIECIWGNIEKIGGTKIADKIADAVIASNILFQVENKDNFIVEAKRILKPAGKVLLVDWADQSSPLGPNRATLIPKEKAREMFEKKGFMLEREIDAGAHHYGMILKKG